MRERERETETERERETGREREREKKERERKKREREIQRDIEGECMQYIPTSDEFCSVIILSQAALLLSSMAHRDTT